MSRNPGCRRFCASLVGDRSHLPAIALLVLFPVISAFPAFAQDAAPAPATPDATAPAQPPATPPSTGTAPAAPPAVPEPTQSEDDGNPYRLTFGPEVGVYLPTNSKTQRAFGSDWVNIGVGIGDIQRAKAGGQVLLDIGLFGTSHGDRRILMAPIGATYRRALGQNPSALPYVGASADLFLTQVRSDPDGIVSRIRGAEGGSVFVGTTFHKNAYVQARYYLVTPVRGYNLSGLNLSTGYRFW